MSTTLSQEQISKILSVARLAPSVHNTQPWKIRYDENTLFVDPDFKHLLKDGDPTGRQSYISLGIFTEALSIGINSVGLDIEKIERDELYLAVTVKKLKAQTDTEPKISNLKRRCTDRSIYKKAAVGSELVKEITNCASDEIQLKVVTDNEKIKKIADYTSNGILLAMSNPEFRRELSGYLVQPWSKSKRGISVKSLYIPIATAILTPQMVKNGLSIKAEAILEKRRWRSSSAVVLITGAGDMPKFWFDAGRAYIKMSLAIEKAGLAQATSGAIPEASDFHEDVEKLVGTDQRILSVTRIGKGSKHRHYSPRISVGELLAT